MRKSKRVISFLLSFLMLSSIFNIAAGALAPYKDTAIPASNYNDLDRPAFTLDQCSSMLLDYTDKILADKNMIIDLGVFGSVSLNSVDNALNSIYNLFNNSDIELMVFPGLPGPLGGLNDLDISGISTYRRASMPAAGADTNVIFSLLEFLNDNSTILSNIVDGTLDMGILNSIVDFSGVNVNQTVKKLLFGQSYPNTAVPAAVTETADNMIQQIINNIIVGTTENPGFFPAMAGHIDMTGSTAAAYDFGEELLQNIYNLVLVPMMNTELKKAVREFCGVSYEDPVTYPDGDESGLNEYAAGFDIHYSVPVHSFAADTTLLSELNSILFEIIDAITVSLTGWVAGDNTHVTDNLALAAKYILKLTDGKFFAEYTGRATDDEIDAMTNQQLFAYLVRSILNSAIGTIDIPDDADTLVEVAWYALKEVLAEKVPRMDYSSTPQTLDGILNMLGDATVYYLNRSIDMNPAAGSLPGEGLLPYGQAFDVTLTAVMAWVKTKYGGLLSVTLTGTDGWADLNTLVTAMIPANWLNGFTTVKDLLKTNVLQSVLDLNLTPLFALFDHVPGNDLATKTMMKVLLEAGARVLNLIFPDALKSTYTTFDELVNNTELKTVVKNVFSKLYNLRSVIMPAILPLLTNVMGLSSPQAFAKLHLSLPKQINAATVFQIRNDSTGVNTAATGKNGNFVQDSLYKIKIESITSSIQAITPTNLAGRVINSGDSVNCMLSGVFAPNNVLMITISYDVYTELGLKLTATPLTAMAFTYISGAGVVDDGANYVTLNPNTANTHTLKYRNIYCNQDYNLAGLAAQDRFIIERTATDENDNSLTAAVTATSAVINATLAANGFSAGVFTNINTTFNGGSGNIQPFVLTSAARPADGAYASSFKYSAGKTAIIGNAETFTVPHYVIFYNDFGLPGLLESELNAKRNPADYSDPAKWNDYISALKNAVAVQYRPRTAAVFMTITAAAYEGVVQALNEAITALETSAYAAGTDNVKTVLESYEPANTGLSYDDPAYNFFGMADYVPFTYLNYQREAANCSALCTSQQQADPVVLESVDVAYALHRLNLYASRTIRVQADKARLNEAITAVGSPVEAQHTSVTWAAFQRAFAFAAAVNAQSAAATDGNGEYILRQTMVDTAREKLIAAYKMLTDAANYTLLIAEITTGNTKTAADWTPESWAPFSAALAAAKAVLQEDLSSLPANQAKINAAAAALHTAIINLTAKAIGLVALQAGVVIGLDTDGNGTIDQPNFLAGLGAGVGANGYVGSSEGGYALFNDGPGGVGTGATVDLYTNSGTLAATYTAIIFGDVNGDGIINTNDADTIIDIGNYALPQWDPVTGTPYFMAGDLFRDGVVDENDYDIIIDVQNNVLQINQSTGEAR